MMKPQETRANNFFGTLFLKPSTQKMRMSTQHLWVPPNVEESLTTGTMNGSPPARVFYGSFTKQAMCLLLQDTGSTSK